MNDRHTVTCSIGYAYPTCMHNHLIGDQLTESLAPDMPHVTVRTGGLHDNLDGMKMTVQHHLNTLYTASAC